MAEVVSGVVGAAVGFAVGGPMGAVYGFQIGYSAGSYLFAPNQTIQGPRIGEMAAQTSREGVPRPIVFGTARPIGGNIIATTPPIIRIRREKQSGGKGGGGSTTVESEEVYRTYAIRICEGPVTGIRRVWRNGKLVYFGGSTDPEQIENNNEFLKKATFHLGGYDQMPSPVLQAAFGVDNVVAHRGTCYMVIDNEDLTQLGGAIPQYVFEVQRAEGIPLTTTVYPIEDIQSVQTGIADVGTQPITEDATQSSGPFIVGGELRTPLQEYEMDSEGVDASGPEIIAGELRTLLSEYDNYAPEAVDESGPEITSGELRVALTEYDDYPPEAVDQSGPEITGGSLE